MGNIVTSQRKERPCFLNTDLIKHIFDRQKAQASHDSVIEGIEKQKTCIDLMRYYGEIVNEIEQTSPPIFPDEYWVLYRQLLLKTIYAIPALMKCKCSLCETSHKQYTMLQTSCKHHFCFSCVLNKQIPVGTCDICGSHITRYYMHLFDDEANALKLVDICIDL